MPGRQVEIGVNYRYGFNGKENDNDVKGEGNQQDYGMRIYDPRLGRFLSVDPICKDYPGLTPYQFSGNDPISAIDMDGLEKISIAIFYQAKSLQNTENLMAALKTAVALAGSQVIQNHKFISHGKQNNSDKTF